MGTLVLLTVEEAGFGFNFNVLQTNLINLAVVIAVLVYFGRKVLGSALAERRSQIEISIREAEQRKQEAAAALADEQQKLAQAQAQATRIRAEAEANAKTLGESILAKTEEDISRMREAAAQDLGAQQERVANELRQRIAALAIQKAETQLKSSLSADTQQQLVDRSIEMVGGPS